MFAQCEADWGLGEKAIVVWCKSEQDARSRVIAEYKKWADLAAAFCKPKALLKYPRCRGEGFPVLASTPAPSPFSEFSSIAPSIHVLSPLPASLELLKALGTIAENPEQRWFLHRVSPDFNRMTQIALSEASRSLIVGATPQQAVGRERSDYMTPGELSRMQREFRQKLSVCSECEFDFELFSPVTKADHRRVWYRYSIVGELPGGDLLQLGLCQGVQPIASPIRS